MHDTTKRSAEYDSDHGMTWEMAGLAVLTALAISGWLALLLMVL